jgi:hypothetical protein
MDAGYRSTLLQSLLVYAQDATSNSHAAARVDRIDVVGIRRPSLSRLSKSRDSGGLIGDIDRQIQRFRITIAT